MDFDSWWRAHGRHNAAATELAGNGVRDVMKLAFEVGAESKRHAVAAERKACREVVEECIRTQAHLASNAREALSEASERIYKRGRA